MATFGDLRIGARLAIGFGVLILALLFVAAFGRLTLGGIDRELNEVVKYRMVKVAQVEALRTNATTIAQAVRDLALMIE